MRSNEFSTEGLPTGACALRVQAVHRHKQHLQPSSLWMLKKVSKLLSSATAALLNKQIHTYKYCLKFLKEIAQEQVAAPAPRCLCASQALMHSHNTHIASQFLVSAWTAWCRLAGLVLSFDLSLREKQENPQQLPSAIYGETPCASQIPTMSSRPERSHNVLNSTKEAWERFRNHIASQARP